MPAPLGWSVPNKANPRGRGNRNDEGITANELDASKEACHWAGFRFSHIRQARLGYRPNAGPAFPVAASPIGEVWKRSHAQAACNIVAARLQP